MSTSFRLRMIWQSLGQPYALHHAVFVLTQQQCITSATSYLICATVSNIIHAALLHKHIEPASVACHTVSPQIVVHAKVCHAIMCMHVCMITYYLHATLR